MTSRSFGMVSLAWSACSIVLMYPGMRLLPGISFLLLITSRWAPWDAPFVRRFTEPSCGYWPPSVPLATWSYWLCPFLPENGH